MAIKGVAVLNFGSTGASYTSVAVTGQTAISVSSVVEAWIALTASSDHSIDEHMVEPIQVYAGDIIAGTGFTIYGFYRGIGGALVLTGQFNVNWVWDT